MSDEAPKSFPQYQAPRIPLSPHPKHAGILMKAIKSAAKMSLKSPKAKKSPLKDKSKVRISHGTKPIWY